MKSRTLLAVVAAVLASACSSGVTSTPSGRAASIDLTIFAAASLGSALHEAAMAYRAANPGITLTISTDSSSALATQIEQGAPADVFLAADTTNPEKLVEGGFAAGDPVVFAGNKLCVIVPAGNPAGVITPADLAKRGLKVVAAGDEVPITRYTAQLVANLAKEPGYPADFATAYAANVVSKEDNVRGVIAKIELGEGDAGVVYVTDAAASDKVETIEIPETANVPASYAGVVVKASSNQPAASEFLDWLTDAEGRSVLARFGFLPPAG